MFSFLKSTTVTLLAREAKFDASNPQNPIVIEGDRKGFLIWILKKLRLVDPSFRIEVQDNLIVTCAGKKQYSYLPASLLSGYSVGYSTKKMFIVIALIFALLSLQQLMSAFADSWYRTEHIVFSLLMGGLAFLLFWLYKRSGALSLTMNLYNGEGAINIRIQSGLTGLKLDKALMEQAIEAAATASKKSTYFS